MYGVYKREVKRHLYITDIQKAHITVDCLSKMRVKLAVQTLSVKVANEMPECDRDVTEGTREYILACAAFWDVFNNHTPIRTSDDPRVTQMNGVLKYFTSWHEWLIGKYKKKSEQAKYFISWQTMSDLKVRNVYF
jgi:hypothetical protein